MGKEKVILHYMNYSAAYRGNFIESLENVNRELKKQGGKNVYVFTCESRNEKAFKWVKAMADSGETVAVLSGKKSEDVKLIKKMIADNGVTAIHTHFVSTKQYLVIREVNKSVNLPLIMHQHNHTNEKKRWIQKKLRNILYKDCIMIACSKSVYESVERVFPNNRKYYADNGVYFERLEQYEEIVDELFGLPHDEKKLLIFGFDFYRKGVDLALQAVKKLRDKGEKYNLLISLSTNFEFVTNNINKIMGELPDWVRVIQARSDVASLYNYVDLFLSPSREEGLPYSVVEASYCNCGVVMSDISAQKYLKVPYGVWCKDCDVDSLAEAIEKADVAHKDKLSHLEETKQSMKDNYSLSTWTDEILRIYDECI